jgi:hypothetical protein
VDDAASHWVIVVHPGQRALYEALRQSLKEEGPVAVVYDRRRRERRGGRLSSRVEGRRVQRRRRGPDGSFYECEVLKIIRTAPTPPLPAPPQSCPECGLEVEFEMPRFPQPPARVVIETVHGGEQHHVEIHEFTATGRPLLSQRNQAWRRGETR